MLELLSTLNLTQLLICVSLIALAAKEFLTVKDFFKKRVDTHYEQKDIKETQIENILQELQELKEHVKEHEKEYDKMQEHIQHMGKHWIEKEEAHRQVLQK